MTDAGGLRKGLQWGRGLGCSPGERYGFLLSRKALEGTGAAEV